MSEQVKSKYTLALTKDGAPRFGYEDDFSVTEKFVDVVWSDVCTRREACKRFHELIKKQSHELRVTKTLESWRVIRLYDADGVQILQES